MSWQLIDPLTYAVPSTCRGYYGLLVPTPKRPFVQMFPEFAQMDALFVVRSHVLSVICHPPLPYEDHWIAAVPLTLIVDTVMVGVPERPVDVPDKLPVIVPDALMAPQMMPGVPLGKVCNQLACVAYHPTEYVLLYQP